MNPNSFLCLLTLLFIGLRLGNIIDWSWYIVFLPILIPIGFLLIIEVFKYIILKSVLYKINKNHLTQKQFMDYMTKKVKEYKERKTKKKDDD